MVKHKNPENEKLVSGLKAIIATDLGKIFSCVMVFLVIFLIVPLLDPLSDPLVEMLGSIFFGVGGDLGEFFVIFIFFILLLMFMIFLFGFGIGLILLKLAFWINRRIAPPVRRSNVQHYTKYIAVIIGIVLAFYLMGLVYDWFTEIMVITLSDAASMTAVFTGTILACITFMIVFLGTIYVCVFVNDLLFVIYRKATHQVVEYIPPEGRAIRRWHRAGFGVLMIILLVSVAVWGFFLLNTRPTQLHIEQRSDAITVTGVTSDQIRVRSFIVIVGSLTPLELQTILEGGVIEEEPSGSPEETLGGMLHFIPHPAFNSHGDLDEYHLDFQLSVPRGLNIMGFALTLTFDDMVTFESYFFPTAGYECGALSKNFAITAITVEVEGEEVTGFSFEVSLEDQFYWSDILNFGW